MVRRLKFKAIPKNQLLPNMTISVFAFKQLTFCEAIKAEGRDINSIRSSI